MKLQGIGIPFFSETEWLKAKRLMDDAHTFHDRYPEFVQAVQNAERQMTAQGIPHVRVALVMEEFIPWCKSTGRKVNAEARSHYAAMKAHKQDQGR
jgi:hypothetical protein